jgi:hypothetical protein
MNLAFFSLKVAFPPAADARVLSHFRRLLNSEHLLQQMLLKQHRRPSVVASLHWDSRKYSSSSG